VGKSLFNTYAEGDQNDFWVLEELNFDQTGNGLTYYGGSDVNGEVGTYEIIEGVLVLTRPLYNEIEYIGLLERISDDHWTNCWAGSVQTAGDCIGLEVEHMFSSESAAQAYADEQNQGSSGPTTLTCGYESGWDDDANDGEGAPLSPNSFAEFNAVVADCGSTIALTKADLVGNVWGNDGSTHTYNDDGSATKENPGTGFLTTDEAEIIDFTWYIETVGANVNFVVESNSDLDSDLPADFWFRETHAITGVTGTVGQSGSTYNVTHYYEQSNFSDTDRATGKDGEIWNTVYTQE
jgi:hypothetical protein